MNIRALEHSDIDAVAAVHQAAFVRQNYSKEWIRCNVAAYPRMQFFVAESNGEIRGFIY